VQAVLIGKYPRPNVKSFAKFAKAAAAALEGQGVTFYSIWNEPNLKAWIRSNNRAAIYRSLYAAGYRAVTRGDRSARVLIGELALHRPLAGDRSAQVPAPAGLPRRQLPQAARKALPAPQGQRLCASPVRLHQGAEALEPRATTRPSARCAT